MLTKQEALRELVFDSLQDLQELRAFVQRIELRSLKKGNEKKVCVIVFSNFFALQEWSIKEASILDRMRELYKQRGLKNVAVFHKVVAEAQGQNRFYKERSKGEFEILSNNPAIRAIFEEIKNTIKENLERERR
ncbi:hypothetical protein [Helicobacter sp. UBA3407]|nr:hypothetical protein [Helicobacter sp. UBA3407]